MKNSEPSERGIALLALIDIIAGGYNNIVLKRTLEKYPKLTKEGRAFVTECVNGTLRRLLTLNYIINQVSAVNTFKMEPFVLNLLRMSVYQLVFMRNEPEYAICNEAVKLVESSKFAHLKGFVNAVLRNICRQIPDILAMIEDIKSNDYVKYIEIKYSCPAEAVQVLLRYIGTEETETMLAYVNENRPVITLCVNTLKTNAATLAAALIKDGAILSETGANTALTDTALRVSKLRVDEFSELYHVMDENAMMVVKLAGLTAGQRVVDVCAAPGGKAFLAAYEMGDSGIIDTRDIYEHKLRLIEEGAKRLGLKSISAKLYDATELDEAIVGTADVVFVDAPCSGLGLIGKKPDIRYRFNMKEVSKLQGLQRRILNTCAKYTKPGGTLVYSTCTLTEEENEKNIRWFLKTHEEYEDAGVLRLLPHKTGGDGFFIAKLFRG